MIVTTLQVWVTRLVNKSYFIINNLNDNYYTVRVQLNDNYYIPYK